MSHGRHVHPAVPPRLRRLIDSGIDDTIGWARVRWVRTINIVAIVSAAGSLAFAAFYSLLDPRSLWPVIVTNLAWVVGYGLVLRVNGLGRPRKAAWLLLIVGLGNTVIPGAVLGARSGVFLFITLVPMFGVLVSGPGDRAMRRTVIIVGLVALAAVPAIFREEPAALRGTVTLDVLFITSATWVAIFGTFFALYYRRLVDTAEAALAIANERSERLLLNLLPESIAERLKADESPIADRVDDVTVLFADLVESTKLAASIPAGELVSILNRLFTLLDEICEEHGLEKITTIGDGYMAVGGLPTPRSDHAQRAANAALAMMRGVGELATSIGRPLSMRIGLAAGEVVAGVIGKRKFRYDLWGDTVNTASRMQTTSEKGRIQVTARVHDLLGDGYEFEPRGAISVKGLRDMETFFLNGASRPAAEDDQFATTSFGG